MILHKLLINKLFVMLKKCEFHVKETTFLSFKVSSLGHTMDERREN